MDGLTDSPRRAAINIDISGCLKGVEAICERLKENYNPDPKPVNPLLAMAWQANKWCSAVLAIPDLAKGDVFGAGLVFLSGKTKVGRPAGVVARSKPINLPAWKKVAVDLDHIKSGHTVGGSRVSQAKTLFPAELSDRQLENMIRQAYRNSTRVQTQGERILVRGIANSKEIMIWVNSRTKTIETAFPRR